MSSDANDSGNSGGGLFADPPRENPWKLLSRRVAYTNPWITVWHDEVVRPDGTEGIYGIVHVAEPSVWIAAVQDGRVLLVGQHRHALGGEWSWELPCGKADEGESPLDAAKRELSEETGVRADSWRELTRSTLANGLSDIRAVCFEATDLTLGEASPDGSERDIETRWVSLDEAVAMVDDGVITDAGSQIALYRLALDTHR